jgi:hypothetical protein
MTTKTRSNRTATIAQLFAACAVVGGISLPAQAGVIVISTSPAPAPAPAPATSTASSATTTSTASAASRTAAIAYGKLGSSTQAAASKFGFVVLNMFPGMGMTYWQTMINNLRAMNPNIKLAQYVVLNEWTTNTTSASLDYYPPYQAIQGSNWWVRYSSGALVQWTGAFGNYEVNVTNWAPTNSAGQRWPQWKASFDTTSVIRNLRGLNYIYIDNVMWQPRYDADLRRIGSNQSRNDPTIQAAFRNGYVSYWNSLRSLNPGLGLIGNADNDLSYVEYKGKLNAAFNECLMGKSWSLETWGGWATMMKRYRATLANTTTPSDVILQACGINGANPAQARYGFASALMENGRYAYTVTGLTDPYWADEFDAPIGTPAEAPPTGPTASGIWMRRYTNGVALVNPGNSTLSIDLGTGYKHVKGTKDPVINNGLAQRVVSLPPRSGLIMIKG